MGPSLVLIFRLATLLPLVCMSNLTTDGVIFMKTCLSTYLLLNLLPSGIILFHNNKAPSYPFPRNRGINCLPHGNITVFQTTVFNFS